jgi:RloB-like protein
MTNNLRNRERKPGRHAPFLDSKPRILVVCEGKATEPEYLTGFKNACHNPRVTLVIEPASGAPKTVVETAKAHMKNADAAAKNERDDNLKYDSVWAVFDVDEHPNVSDAIQMARDNFIKLAVSNPSFELWLLLHFRDSPGLKHRDAVRRLLKDFVDGYSKHVTYNDYSAGYEQAVQRAKGLDQVDLGACVPGCNPSTGVHELTESIRVS